MSAQVAVCAGAPRGRTDLDELLGRSGTRQQVSVLAIDFGGTLSYRRLPLSGRVICAAIYHAYDWSPPPGFGDLLQQWLDQARAADRIERRHTALSEVLAGAAAAHGARLPGTAQNVMATVLATVPDRQIDPDAAQAVRELAHRFRLVLASNTDFPMAVRRKSLQTAGILGCFDSIVLSSELGCAKPAREFYEHIVRLSAEHPGQVLFIGDDQHADYRGPRAAGMQALLVAPVWMGADDNLEELPRFRDVPAVLDVDR